MELPSNTNMCRCCASEGTFKDMKTKYHWMGDEEVYADILRECFDICLMETDTGEDGGICEVCITQLRNAANFKKQVLNTEEQFKRRLENKMFKSDVKVELAEESNESDNDASEDYIPDFEVPVKSESVDEHKPKKRAARTITLKAKKAKKSTGEPSARRTDVASPMSEKKKKKYVCATPERKEHRVNLTTILKYSNASPFRDKTQHGFSCLYCAKVFKDIADLRLHTAIQSEKDKIKKIIDYKLSNNPIKVDITDLKCNICSRDMRDLNYLKDHLITTHQKTIHKDIKDIILPFRLENGQNFTCVVCLVVHTSFHNLYQHMSSHYRNYCCQTCGAGYITNAALRKHGITHFQGNFPCGNCEKVFTSLTKKRNHEKGVHGEGWLRNKCPHCPEAFVRYYDRNEHLVKVHNAAPVVYSCNACNKTYKRKFVLNRHIKRHHWQQESYVCDKCNARFYIKLGLIRHLSRHTEGEVYTCDVCGKTFSRQINLKEHMKNHEDDKRFQCEVCNKTFMQKNGLEKHRLFHQDDLEMFKEFDDVKHLIDNREMTLKDIAAEMRKRDQDERMKRQQQTENQHEQVMSKTDLIDIMAEIRKREQEEQMKKQQQTENQHEQIARNSDLMDDIAAEISKIEQEERMKQQQKTEHQHAQFDTDLIELH